MIYLSLNDCLEEGKLVLDCDRWNDIHTFITKLSEISCGLARSEELELIR